MTPLERRHARELAEERFNGLLHRACANSVHTIRSIASRLQLGGGKSGSTKSADETARNKLSAVFRGGYRFSAGALYRLPVDVLCVVVDDLAAHCGRETRPVGEASAVSASRTVTDLCDVISALTLAAADGKITPDETPALRKVIAGAREELAALDAVCQKVDASRLGHQVLS